MIPADTAAYCGSLPPMAAAAPPSAADCTAKTTPAAAQRAEAPATHRPALPQPHLFRPGRAALPAAATGASASPEKPAPPMQPPPAAAQGCSCARRQGRCTAKTVQRQQSSRAEAHPGTGQFSCQPPIAPETTGEEKFFHPYSLLFPAAESCQSRKTPFFCPARGICPSFFAKKYCQNAFYTL